MRYDEALGSLKILVKKVVDSGARDRISARQFLRENEQFAREIFGYPPDLKIAPACSLMNMSFHPSLPLILLNYTSVAHNTLHHIPEGWTRPLRLCRGTVLDFDGNLIARAFEKFFNYGETPETSNLRGSFIATQKHDGHLAIIFKYGDKFLVTTRGDFTSPTSMLARHMIDELAVTNNWASKFRPNWTVLAEFIHPRTKVGVDYQGAVEFVVIGVMDKDVLDESGDLDYPAVRAISDNLGLPVTEVWNGRSVDELVSLISDKSIKNKEGFVARFDDGKRVKFKFSAYIGELAAGRLNHRYLIGKIISGKLERMFRSLSFEHEVKARKMLEDLELALNRALMLRDESILQTDKKGKPLEPGQLARKVLRVQRQILYDLLPKDKQTSSFKESCRRYLKHVGLTKPARSEG